jgi:hypothetical protein
VSGRVTRTWLPLALLGVAVVAAATALRRPAAPSQPGSSEPEATVGDLPAPPASTPGRPSDPPLDDFERRDSRMHLAHDLCEAGALRINELSGLEPDDPQARRTMSVCLRHGNIAWYKCILRASDRDQALTCNRRLLVGDNVP